MYEILITLLKYFFIFVIYQFIFRIVKLIYLDIKTITEGEDAKSLVPHLKLYTCIDGKCSDVAEQSFPLIKRQVTIGRSKDCDIIIKDTHTSAIHARIWKDNKQIAVEDLNSANGTYLNDVKIEKKIFLKDGDIISVGNSLLIFSEGGN